MIILLYSSHGSWENEVLFVQLGFWTYGLIRLLGPSGQNLVSWSQAPWSIFFDISWFYWIHLMMREKRKSCFFFKLELNFWTNGFISLLLKDFELNCPNLCLGPRPQMSLFNVNFHKMLHQISLYFQNLHFYSQKTAKMPSFWCHLRYVSFLLHLH